ncbi:MAG: hypothetical protein HC906_16925 [Bacteroidales bacterium]|nr:hypothetical protein [Bacteroidales bacterium]
MPAEHDWILYAPYSDKTLMRNLLTFELGAQLGNYQCRGRFVELYLNEDYRGIYVLLEKIKRDENRIDISRLEETENTGDDLTGGYILKIDRIDNVSTDGWISPYNENLHSGIGIVYVYPEPDDITSAQKTILRIIY